MQCRIDGGVRHLDVGSPHPGAVEGPKGLAVRQLKGYASWVQTVDALIARRDANLRMHTNDTNRLAHEQFEPRGQSGMLQHVTAVSYRNV